MPSPICCRYHRREPAKWLRVMGNLAKWGHPGDHHAEPFETVIWVCDVCHQAALERRAAGPVASGRADEQAA